MLLRRVQLVLTFARVALGAALALLSAGQAWACSCRLPRPDLQTHEVAEAAVSREPSRHDWSQLAKDDVATTKLYVRCARAVLREAAACPWLEARDEAPRLSLIGALRAYIDTARRGEPPEMAAHHARHGIAGSVAVMLATERPMTEQLLSSLKGRDPGLASRVQDSLVHAYFALRASEGATDDRAALVIHAYVWCARNAAHDEVFARRTLEVGPPAGDLLAHLRAFGLLSPFGSADAELTHVGAALGALDHPARHALWDEVTAPALPSPAARRAEINVSSFSSDPFFRLTPEASALRLVAWGRGGARQPALGCRCEPPWLRD